MNSFPLSIHQYPAITSFIRTTMHRQRIPIYPYPNPITILQSSQASYPFILSTHRIFAQHRFIFSPLHTPSLYFPSVLPSIHIHSFSVSQSSVSQLTEFTHLTFRCASTHLTLPCHLPSRHPTMLSAVECVLWPPCIYLTLRCVCVCMQSCL